jgi:hypothetical protein
VVPERKFFKWPHPYFVSPLKKSCMRLYLNWLEFPLSKEDVYFVLYVLEKSLNDPCVFSLVLLSPFIWTCFIIHVSMKLGGILESACLSV